MAHSYGILQEFGQAVHVHIEDWSFDGWESCQLWLENGFG